MPALPRLPLRAWKDLTCRWDMEWNCPSACICHSALHNSAIIVSKKIFLHDQPYQNTKWISIIRRLDHVSWRLIKSKHATTVRCWQTSEEGQALAGSIAANPSWQSRRKWTELVETLCNEISLFLDLRFVSHTIPCSTVPCIGDAVSRSFPENVLGICISRNCPTRMSLSQKIRVSTFDLRLGQICVSTPSSLAPVHGHKVWLLSLVKNSH